MADQTKSKSPMSNVAVVSHCPNQQTATIIFVKQPSVFSRILDNFAISNKDGKISFGCTREKWIFFICKLINALINMKRCGLTSAENYL